MPSEQSKNFCFTINNYDQQTFEHLEDLVDEECQHVEYIIAGREVAPTTGTPHLQGFIRFKKNKTLLSAIGTIENAHVEICRGGAKKAIAYCKKEDKNPFEVGTPPKTQGQGQKDRWKKARDNAKRGNFEEIDDELYLKYINNMKAIHAEAQEMPEKLDHLTHLWIYGKTGTGKSHVVHETYPERYIKNLNKWWDGYTGQDVVHIDEIDPTHTNMVAHLKKWADLYPFNAEIKGSSKMIRPKKIIVTSNYSIDEMNFPAMDHAAIKRRFKEIEKKRDQSIMI